MKTTNLFRMLVMIAMMCLPAITNAQTDPPMDPADVPLDGGLSILLAAGIGYGIKKGYSNRKKKMKENDENELSAK